MRSSAASAFERGYEHGKKTLLPIRAAVERNFERLAESTLEAFRSCPPAGTDEGLKQPSAPSRERAIPADASLDALLAELRDCEQMYETVAKLNAKMLEFVDCYQECHTFLSRLQGKTCSAKLADSLPRALAVFEDLNARLSKQLPEVEVCMEHIANAKQMFDRVNRHVSDREQAWENKKADEIHPRELREGKISRQDKMPRLSRAFVSHHQYMAKTFDFDSVVRAAVKKFADESLPQLVSQLCRSHAILRDDSCGSSRKLARIAKSIKVAGVPRAPDGTPMSMPPCDFTFGTASPLHFCSADLMLSLPSPGRSPVPSPGCHSYESVFAVSSPVVELEPLPLRTMRAATPTTPPLITDDLVATRLLSGMNFPGDGAAPPRGDAFDEVDVYEALSSRGSCYASGVASAASVKMETSPLPTIPLAGLLSQVVALPTQPLSAVAEHLIMDDVRWPLDHPDAASLANFHGTPLRSAPLGTLPCVELVNVDDGECISVAI